MNFAHNIEAAESVAIADARADYNDAQIMKTIIFLRRSDNQWFDFDEKSPVFTDDFANRYVITSRGRKLVIMEDDDSVVVSFR